MVDLLGFGRRPQVGGEQVFATITRIGSVGNVCSLLACTERLFVVE